MPSFNGNLAQTARRAAFNLSIGSDRPDLVIVDQDAQQVVSIIEVKIGRAHV